MPQEIGQPFFATSTTGGARVLTNRTGGALAPPAIPPPGLVRLTTRDERLSLTAVCGDLQPLPGVGGWEEVPRPGRPSLTVWRGVAPTRYTVPILLDGWSWASIAGHPLSVQRDENKLREMAGEGTSVTPPRLLMLSRHVRAQDREKLWVIESIEPGGDIARIRRQSDGVLVRAQYVLTMLEHVQDDQLLEHVQRRGKSPRYRHVKARAGDTFAKIAARELGGRKFGSRLARLNNRRSASGRVREGERVKLPTGATLAEWRRELRDR